MINKNIINKLLGRFGVELHGTGYVKKLRKESSGQDAFEFQKEFSGEKIKVIIDAGANRGDVTRKYHELFPDAAIHAFEPFPDLHTAFLQQFGNEKNIFLNKEALSGMKGSVDFYLNESADTNSLLEPDKIGASSDTACLNKGVIRVPTVTLDDYCREKGIVRIDILKMDTQGSELSILKGGESLLKNKKIGLIYTEAYFKNQYKEQPLFYDIANYLRGFGYYLEGIYDPYYNEKFMLWCDAIFIAEE
jgi:FkbM family methyltransferase